MKLTKHILLLTLVSVFATACGINKQTRELKALEDCKYHIRSADSVYLAGIAIKDFSTAKDFNLAKYPGIALGLLRKNIPIEGNVNLQITNPTSRQASINQFEYLIMIKGREIANGFVNQKVSIGAGSSTIIPIALKANIYSLLADDKIRNEIIDFLNTNKEQKGLVTLKIKPNIVIGNKLIKYPGYISIDKELSNKILL
ncbi:late embryogenesis abundant protein [Pedobacter glucosidilyticus]|nr:LEA type 2 family protein [Pedobacter glucosidilyticus]KHJ39661.1 late embryogenesis abundant protein [Pedobacter glucosidilyticus]